MAKGTATALAGQLLAERARAEKAETERGEWEARAVRAEEEVDIWRQRTVDLLEVAEGRKRWQREAEDQRDRAVEALRPLTEWAEAARGHYGIEECARPGQPQTEWDEIQDGLQAAACDARATLKDSPAEARADRGHSSPVSALRAGRVPAQTATLERAIEALEAVRDSHFPTSSCPCERIAREALMWIGMEAPRAGRDRPDASTTDRDRARPEGSSDSSSSDTEDR